MVRLLAVITLCSLGVGVSVGARNPREVLEEARRAYEARQVDRAEALDRDALRLAESGSLPREQAEALLGLGRIELEGDRRTAAKQDFDRALTLFETAGAGDTPGHAEALAASGQARVLLGDAAEGVRRVQAASDALRAAGDVERLARASAILMSVMPPGPAKDRARDAALAAARASSSRGHECAIRHAWGGDLLRAGEYAEAWRLLTDAVTCYEGVPNDRRLANALVSLGSLKRTHGQFDEALVLFARAAAIGRERNDPVGTVVALNAVASAQTDLWRVDEARASLDAALALARERKMETLAPYMVGQLGAHLTQIGQFAAAIPFLEESLAQAIGAPRQIERLTQLCAARARRTSTGTGAAASTGTGTGAGAAAAAGTGGVGAEAAAADARAALPICDRNVTLARGDSPTALLYALRARAEARRRAGAVEEASADLREAVELVEDLRKKTVPIDFMKRGFSAWHEWLFGSAIALSVQQGDLRQALETAERARARALLDLLATREAGGESPAATVPEMIATARRLHSTLLVYWMTPDAVFIWTIAPDGAIHDARVDVPMAKVIGLVASTRAPASQDAAGGLFALKASSSRRPWRELHDLLIAPVRAHLPKTPDALITIVPHGPLAQLSFAALQDEQGRYLLERHTLHYTPAIGVLAYTAKRQERRQQDARDGTGRQQAGDARSSRAVDTQALDTRTALLVGDPGELPGGVDGTPLAALPWARKEVTEVAALLGGGTTVLTDAQASEAAVRERLSGRSLLHFATHGVVREDETLGSFLALRGDGESASASDVASPSATSSERASAAAPASSTVAAEADGRLTADEVYELKLDADLVVLSACSSALGPTGTEGVIGFTRAFLYAGASSVVATSWNVPDSSSYELMHRFYGARRGTPTTARALRAAQLSTLTALRQGKVTVTAPAGLNDRGTTVALPDHPLFWAGFIVVGEP